MICKICDRPKATEEQYRNIPEGEGEHLCWGEWSPQQCHSEAVNWYEKYEELAEENKKLKAEIAEAHAALYPAGLVTGEGKEIPTTLLERAKMAVMIIDTETDHANEVAEERDEYIKKYDDLLVNFKDLDRYNDVLYRLYHAARRLRNSGYDGPFIGEVTEELYSCIAGVERYERELVETRKKTNSSN